jgi:hypothetical protein
VSKANWSSFLINKRLPLFYRATFANQNYALLLFPGLTFCHARFTAPTRCCSTRNRLRHSRKSASAAALTLKQLSLPCAFRQNVWIASQKKHRVGPPKAVDVPLRVRAVASIHVWREHGHLTGYVSNLLEQRLGCRDRGRMVQVSRPFGPQCVNTVQGLAEDFFVKEENCIERLILAAGRQVTLASQTGQEAFQFLLTGKRIGHAIQSDHVMTQPTDVV